MPIDAMQEIEASMGSGSLKLIPIRSMLKGKIFLNLSIHGPKQEIIASARICVMSQENPTLCLELSQVIHQAIAGVQAQINAHSIPTSSSSS